MHQKCHQRCCIAAVAFLVLLNSLILVDGRPAVGEQGSDFQFSPVVMCKLPAARGHCRALLTRWRYDPAVGRCQEFKFGGCDGNANNFISQKACMHACGGV